jgi:hypothetical protein
MKRIASGMLWALVVMWIGSYVTHFFGMTAALTLPLGAVAAGLLIMDPTGHLWGKPLAFQRATLSEVSSAPSQELAHQL